MANLRNWNFLPYNKEELFSKINSIEIFQEGSQVITKYFNRVINTTEVSKQYEIFDISKFLKEKIKELSSNFNITNYKFVMKRGTQELTLLSDSVDINGNIFYKAFFILNSSDKSRKLNMNMGLFREDNNTYLVSTINNMSLCKKHIKGVTQAAEIAAEKISIETFDNQINDIKSLVGERVLLSNIQKIILDKDIKVNHLKFDAFKNKLMWSNTDKIKGLSKEQSRLLMTPSNRIVFNPNNDISVDAYSAFNCYLQVFSNQDSYIVKKETEKILNITQCFIRNKKLNELLEII